MRLISYGNQKLQRFKVQTEIEIFAHEIAKTELIRNYSKLACNAPAYAHVLCAVFGAARKHFKQYKLLVADNIGGDMRTCKVAQRPNALHPAALHGPCAHVARADSFWYSRKKLQATHVKRQNRLSTFFVYPMYELASINKTEVAKSQNTCPVSCEYTQEKWVM